MATQKKATKKKKSESPLEVINSGYEPECPIESLSLHEANPRQGDIGALHLSMQHNGFYGALVVQKSTNKILAGNHRYQAAVQRGATTIPVIWVECSDAEAKRILLSDNRHSDLAAYENNLLAELIEQVKIDETGLELLGTGWDEESFSNLLNDMSGELFGEADEAKQGLTEDDEVPEVPEEPVSMLGDLWILGNHRLLCGDSTSETDTDRLMNGSLADTVFTDPPYNVDYDPEARHSTFSAERTKKKLGKIKNDKKSPAEFREFLDGVYSCINRSVKEGRGIYICHADVEGHHFRNAFIAQPWKLQSCLIWKKTVLCFGRADYHWMHEPILYGWKEGASHEWHGDRKQTTVIEVPTDHYAKSESDTGGKYVHPTQKPTALAMTMIGNSSLPGEIILDLFGGSGSTMIACEKIGRHGRLMELDPRFADVIVKRWQDFTGQEAKHEDGSTFNERLASRQPNSKAA